MESRNKQIKKALFVARQRKADGGVPDNNTQNFPSAENKKTKQNNLILLHNTRADRLEKADQLGGFAVPSLAIVKPDIGFHSFGDVSLIGHPNMAVPSRDNPVYASDVYSPRFPSLNEEGTKIFKGFTNSGNRRYVPLTLENAVREMKGNVRGGEKFNSGAGSVRSGITPKFANLETMKNYQHKIIPSEDFKPLKELANEKLFNLSEEFHPYSKYSGSSFQHADDFASMLQEAGTKGVRHIKQWYNENLPDDLIGKADEYLKYLKNMPTEYFEAKPQRAVKISEFSGAIVPKDQLDKVGPLLKKHGISRIESYEGNTEQERKNNRNLALNKFKDLTFKYGGEVENKEMATGGTADDGGIQKALALTAAPAKSHY